MTDKCNEFFFQLQRAKLPAKKIPLNGVKRKAIPLQIRWDMHLVERPRYSWRDYKRMVGKSRLILATIFVFFKFKFILYIFVYQVQQIQNIPKRRNLKVLQNDATHHFMPIPLLTALQHWTVQDIFPMKTVAVLILWKVSISPCT